MTLPVWFTVRNMVAVHLELNVQMVEIDPKQIIVS